MNLLPRISITINNLHVRLINNLGIKMLDTPTTFTNLTRALTDAEMKNLGPVLTGWWDCCGCSTMYRFEAMYQRYLQLDQWLKRSLPSCRRAMCLVVLNEAEYNDFGKVFEANKFRLIGDVVRNGESGSKLHTLCYYKRETEQERDQRFSLKTSAFGEKI